ncbi:serine/threonine protein kinase [Paenibacillus tritici]|uniref:serine/threonine-protein kinase n=1 Tax=Paenibacillus tritici TaxID=1873425 RepID=UPI001BA4E298|nr:serine/threonine-protein kinase [Paenibacillus tritici]QUL52448.1 serine/threonine protein kinase [Paenibacillus tritici]
MEFAGKLSPGQVLGERYRITGLIGTGGMSRVYLAEDVRLQGMLRAVKESVIREGSYGAGAIQAEAELLISLYHPLLPRIADFFPPDPEGYTYLVMDYIEGITLHQSMAEQRAPLKGARIISYARQLLEVLHYLHSHQPPIIYRDLKPSNIMLTGEYSLKVIDFGIARRLRSGSGEDTEKLGTAGFAAPEQYGDGQSSPQSDLYGLGALLLYMASGGQFSAWQSGMERKLQGHIPDRLIPVIRRLLRHHPEERYASAEEVRIALEALEAGGAEKAPSYLLHRRIPTVDAQPRQAVVVAVMGVSSGLGTTHTSLAVSSCLSQSGLTAWVDCSPDSQVFNRMKEMADTPECGSVQDMPERPFTWNHVDFWKLAPADGLPQRPDQSYSFIVLDLGTGGGEGALDVFTGSTVPLLIASGADWRLADLLHWLRRRGLVPRPEWRIGLPLAGEHNAALLASALGSGGVCPLPLQQDPFQSKGKLVRAIRGWLGLTSAPRLSSGIFQKKS